MVTIGVDPHKRLIVAVALDADGQECSRWSGANTPDGWQDLQDWAREQDAERVWGIEGSGHYGRGLAQRVAATDAVVYEVNPRWTAAMRQRARHLGKSDHKDAVAIAQVVRHDGVTLPRVLPDDATSVAAELTREREDDLATATQLRNRLYQQLHQLDPTEDRDLTDRDTVTALHDYAVAADAAALRQTRAATVRRLATQLMMVLEQLDELTAELAAEARDHWAPLMDLPGVGALTAGMLAGYLGPGQRFTSDAQLAAYAGVAPLETGSAGITRQRLNRQGQRQLNAVIHRIALTQARCSPDARAYLERRRTDGKTWREAIRALKRYIVRAIVRCWQRCGTPPARRSSATP